MSGRSRAELADPHSRAARIDEALAQLDAQTRVDPDDPAGPDDRPPPAAQQPESTESVEPEPVPRDRSARIAQAQARIDAEIAAERAERDATVQAYLARIAAGENMTGRVPAEVQVAVAEQRLAETTAEAKCARRAADAGPARGGRGRLPVPVDQYCRVQRQRARLEQARAAEAARALCQRSRGCTINHKTQNPCLASLMCHNAIHHVCRVSRPAAESHGRLQTSAGRRRHFDWDCDTGDKTDVKAASQTSEPRRQRQRLEGSELKRTTQAGRARRWASLRPADWDNLE